MPASLTGKTPQRTIGDILAVGFGTAAAMWGVGFLTHLPAGEASGGGTGAGLWIVPGPVVFGLLIVVLLSGGWIAGRTSDRGWRAGLWSGGLTGLVNLLVFGAVVRSLAADHPLAYAALWAPITIVASAALGAIAAALGSINTRATADARSARNGAVGGGGARNWPLAFALVTCGVTLLLIAVGGTVTGMEAGLAVPDWPDSFGYNMFLLPLAKMTGGIYFEHSHRLLGTLVGLTTLVFAIYLQFTTARRWVKNLALGVVALVVIQGVLGGLRVIENDLAMAMVHGTLAQIILSLLVTIACALSFAWSRIERPLAHPKGGADRKWGAITLALVLLQIIIGVILRQHGDKLKWALHLHLTLAVIVATVATIYSLRIWSLEGKVPSTPRIGKLILHVLGTQFLLGIAALWAVLVENPDGGPQPIQVLITTAHQTMGALLLAMVTATFVWHLHTVRPGARGVAAEVSKADRSPA